MTYQDLSREQFSAFAKMPIDTPLQMLNLLKFKDHVEETGRTGKEQYKEYSKQAAPFLKNVKAKVIYAGAPQFTLIGPDGGGEWDKVLIVEYDTKQDFLDMVTTSGYPAHIRRLAIADSRLIFCQPQAF